MPTQQPPRQPPNAPSPPRSPAPQNPPRSPAPQHAPAPPAPQNAPPKTAQAVPGDAPTGRLNDPRFDKAAPEVGQAAEVPRDFRLAEPGDRDYVAGQPIDEAEFQRTQEAARRRAEANRDLDNRRADEARAGYASDERNPNRQPGYVSDPNRQPPDPNDPYHRPDHLTDPNRKPDDFNDPDRRPTGVTDPTVRPDDIGNDERQPPSRR